MLNRLNEGQNAQENAFDVDALRRHLSAVSKHSQNTNVNVYVTDICLTCRLLDRGLQLRPAKLRHR